MSGSFVFVEQEPFGSAAARDRAKAAFVVQLVAMVTDVPATEITRATRAQGSAARARGLAMYLLNVALSMPLMRVAAAFGRDRTTVGQAVSRMEDLRSEPAFDEALRALERCARAAPLQLSSRALGIDRRVLEDDR
jgi:chromosomal replication initiation ATPase DnaA